MLLEASTAAFPGPFLFAFRGGPSSVGPPERKGAAQHRPSTQEAAVDDELPTWDSIMGEHGRFGGHCVETVARAKSTLRTPGQ